MSDELIKVPAFLAAEIGDYGIMPACDFCKEVACETAAMTCGQCSGQSCSGQCSVSECSVAQCGQCDINETGCGPQCFQCGTCESCQSSECKLGECILCQSGQCGSCEKCQGCQSSCERNCQGCEGCEGCETVCEKSSQDPSPGASLSISGGPGELTWRISGLSKPFNTANGYVRAGITKDRFTVGNVSSITGIIDYKNAPSSGTSTTVSRTISYNPGTYIFWGFTETKLGGYWPTGSSVTVTVEPEFVPFDWTYEGLDEAGDPVRGTTKKAERGVYVTASEWNELVDLVNNVKGKSIAHVKQGALISATAVNKVASALGVRQVSAGDEMTAAFFNSLRTAYNALG